MALRATYRLQLGPELDFARARELVPYLRELGVSHLYLSPALQARPGSTHGYDVIDPDAGLGRPRRRAGSARARAGRAGDHPRHRSQPHGRQRGEPLVERPAAAQPLLRPRPRDGRPTGASSTSTISPRCARRTPRSSRSPTARCSSWYARACSTACASTIPTAWPTRPATSTSARRGRDARLGGEDPRATPPGEELRDWPVDGTVGYEFLNDAAALFVDPAGEALLTALWTEVSGDARPFPKSRSRPSWSRLVAPSGASSSASGASHPASRWTAWPAPSRRCPSTAPTSSPGAGAWSPPTTPRSPRSPTTSWPRCSRSRSRTGSRRSSSPAFSRPPRRSPPRGSRTPPSTATCDCSRSTRSAATRRASD